MTGKRKVYSVELKLKTLERMRAGESVKALAAELGVHPHNLYEWRDTYRKNNGSFRRRGLPSFSDVLEAGASIDDPKTVKRIAELERLVGEQAVLIDFFKGALRRIEASRRASTKPGATASSPRSKR